MISSFLWRPMWSQSSTRSGFNVSGTSTTTSFFPYGRELLLSDLSRGSVTFSADTGVLVGRPIGLTAGLTVASAGLVLVLTFFFLLATTLAGGGLDAPVLLATEPFFSVAVFLVDLFVLF